MVDKDKKFYAIRVKSISNKLLIKDGWGKGSWTRQVLSGWLQCYTLERANVPDLFDSPEFFDELIQLFAGVKFEKVYFRPVEK